MEIFTWNDIQTCLNSGKEIPFFDKGCGISVGSFDGLHKGHRVLLNTLLESCSVNNLLSGVVTFKRPLPSIKHSSDYTGDVSTLHQRLDFFEKLGIDFVITVDFDETFASMLGTDFFDLLRNVCNMKLIAEGVDFRCGYKGATDTQALSYYGKQNNLLTVFVDPVFYPEADGSEERISSSYIRKMIKNGFLSATKVLLERPYMLDLPLESQILPPDGAYHCTNEKGEDVRITIKKGMLTVEKDSRQLIFN